MNSLRWFVAGVCFCPVLLGVAPPWILYALAALSLGTVIAEWRRHGR